MNNEQLLTNAECDITGSIKGKNEPTPSNDIIERKTCAKCKCELSFGMFNKRNNETLDCYCKSCRPVIAHNWRMNNLDTVKQREKLYKYNNKSKIQQHQKEYNKRWIARIKSRFSRWKRSAYQRNIPFDLTLEQLESMPLVCYYTGDALVLKSNERNTVSLDRLDSSKGYTITNVVYCCAFVNLMKHESSYEQFVDVCKIIADRYNEKKSLPTWQRGW